LIDGLYVHIENTTPANRVALLLMFWASGSAVYESRVKRRWLVITRPFPNRSGEDLAILPALSAEYRATSLVRFSSNRREWNPFSALPVGRSGIISLRAGPVPGFKTPAARPRRADADTDRHCGHLSVLSPNAPHAHLSEG
jgi:hypothetical protein